MIEILRILDMDKYQAANVAEVRFGPVQRLFSLNAELNSAFGSSTRLDIELNFLERVQAFSSRSVQRSNAFSFGDNLKL